MKTCDVCNNEKPDSDFQFQRRTCHQCRIEKLRATCKAKAEANKTLPCHPVIKEFLARPA